MIDDTIYLDYNATTPVDDRVLEAMLPYFKHQYANPGSSHLSGLAAREALDEATEKLAGTLSGKPGNIVYTSGATEAINLAIKGLLPSDRKHIVAVSTEHKAVLETCSFMERSGYRVTYLPVNTEGIIDLDQLREAVSNQTFLVCAMLANNETGIIHPLKEITGISHDNGALVLCDATQAIGKLPVNVRDLDSDLLAFSAHKFYGPKGIGGLYISGGAKKRLSPQLHGGGQQEGLRSGTLNVPGIVGMGTAAAIAAAEMPAAARRIGALRDRLEAELLRIPGTFRNGHLTQRLYNTGNICFPGVQSAELIINLGSISVSSGAACSGAVTKPSHVLKAMGLSDAQGLSSLRFSLGKYTTVEEIDKTTEAVKRVVTRLRGE